MLERLFVERMDGNEEIFTRLMNDTEFKQLASKYLVKEVYEGILKKIQQIKLQNNNYKI